jgi:hypothetical protein
MTTSRSPRVSVEWVYVRYSTVVLIVVALIAAGGFGAWYWLGGGGADASTEAAAAIAEAEAAIAEAKIIEPSAAAVGLATDRLVSARERFGAGAFQESLEEAEIAVALANDVVDRHTGKAGTVVRVVKVDGDVRFKKAGLFLWEEVNERTVLGPGDQIRSGSQGSAQLIYFDGTLMTIHPGTLLEIRELYRDKETRKQRVHDRLAFGALMASTQSNEGVESVHEVSTESAAIVTRESSEFFVSHDKERGRSEYVALRGSVNLRTETGEEPLDESTRTLVERGEVVETTRLLSPPRLVSPPDQKTFTIDQASGLKMVWDAVHGARRYELEISERPYFTTILHEARQVRGTSSRPPRLSPGSYFWRVAAVDEHGHRGGWASPKKFRILGERFRDPDDREPPALQVSEILVVGINAIITGQSEPGAVVWIDGERVDVEDDGSFTWVIRLIEGNNEIRFVAQDAAGNETSKLGHAYVDTF